VALLLGAVFALQGQGVEAVAWIVAVTTLVAPALDIAMLLYLTLPLRLGMRPPGFATVFRFAQAARPWGMIEVFLLGVLVSLVKLASLATVLPGIALWSFGALMVLLAAASGSLDAHQLWEHAERVA
jgi:paraquat-inducible protein A